MKSHILFFLLLSIVFIGCNSDSSDGNNPEVITEDTVRDKVNYAVSDSSVVIKNSPDIWTADFVDETNTFDIHKPTNTRLDTLSGEKLVTRINNNWDSIRLKFIKSSHDTIYVSIPDSKRLTQGLGSTGAVNYMATTTFTLTEATGIKYVHYDFQMGDHASPGVYTRNDFKDFK
ncbi:MAG: hypothetical protein ABIN25_10525 [Ginsengibacter sp.]